MKIIAEPLPGVKIIEPSVFADQRGSIVKTYHEQVMLGLGI